MTTGPSQLELTDYQSRARSSLSALGGEGQGEVAPQNLQSPISNLQSTEPDEKDLQQLLGLLSASAAWLTAEQITLQLAWNDRKIRKLAAASAGLIISGNNGYKHTRHATPEEFHEFYGRMTEQAKEMLARAEKARRVHHQFVG